MVSWMMQGSFSCYLALSMYKKLSETKYQLYTPEKFF